MLEMQFCNILILRYNRDIKMSMWSLNWKIYNNTKKVYIIKNHFQINYKKSGISNGINSFQLEYILSLSLYKNVMLEVNEFYKHPLSSSNKNITNPQTIAACNGKASQFDGNNFLLYIFDAIPIITLLIT